MPTSPNGSTPRDPLITEQSLSDYADIDLRETEELVLLVNDEDTKVPAAVRGAAAGLAAAIDAIVARLLRGGRLVYVGAGSSGGLALVDAAEWRPTFGVPDGLVSAIVPGETDSRGAAQELEDDADAGAAAIDGSGVGGDDVVVALSAGGRTPYVLGAARAARLRGALTVGVVCAADSQLGRLVDHEIVTVVGPEIVAGSTRMKAGTAQKLVLNTISTVAMIKLGKTFGNLMVDVVASNAKLRARARRAVIVATGRPEADVDAALQAAGGEAKVAIVSLLCDVDAACARARLEACGGVVRRALSVR